MRLGKQEKEVIRKIVAEEIQDILRREFSDLKTQIKTMPEPKRGGVMKPKKIGRTTESGYEHGSPGEPMQRGGNPGDYESSGRKRGSGGGQVSGRPIGPTIPANASVKDLAHVLAQAQFELSQELEENLRTLRYAIKRSQDIARRIERILGKRDFE